ncbi:MAG: hypothetical protein KVP17_000735 [Porospora cf. gigantea B]|uniref:uncharacterized protein n=1 Tax=Porospora cf. gigantea B TaxID=2853592 RepID=UPI0035718367|nr:MAG: hypothetical protein KVP17_000735 [Porospora cf. gigantea B]
MPIDQESLLYLPDVIRRGRRAQSPASEEPPTLPAAQEDISPPAEPREGWVLPPGYDSHGGIETSYASSWTLALDNCFLDLCCSPDDDCCIRYLTMRGECRRAAEMFSVLLVQSLSFGEAGPTLCRCRYIKEVSCANAETADIWSLHKPKFHRDRVYLCPGGLVITLVRGGNVFTFPTLRSDGSEVPPVTEQALADLAKMPASEQRLLYLDRQAGFTPLWSCDTSVGDRVNLTGGACVLQGSVDVVTARKAYSLEVKAAEAIFAGVLASPEPRLLPPVCFLVTYAGCTLFVEGLVPRHCVDLLAHNRNWIFSGQPSVPEYTTPFEAIMSKGQVALETYDINLHEALEQITRITNARLRIGPSTAYIRSEVVAMIDEREAVRDRMLAYLSSKYGVRGGSSTHSPLCPLSIAMSS